MFQGFFYTNPIPKADFINQSQKQKLRVLSPRHGITIIMINRYLGKLWRRFRASSGKSMMNSNALEHLILFMKPQAKKKLRSQKHNYST
jgi:hypothetical protein